MQGSGSVRHFRYLLVVSGHSHLLRCRLLFFLLSQVSHGSRLQGRLAGRSIEPVTHHAARPNGGRLAHQHKKGGLETVFHVGLVVQDTPANAQDHRPVPPNQGFKGVIVPLADKKLKQLGIGGRAAALEPKLPQKLY